jgi:O-antigen ligase
LTALLEKIKNTSRIDYINYLILIYAFTLSFPSEVKRVVAILMIILWITDRTKYDFKLPKTNIFLFFWIFIGYCILSYFWSDVSFNEALKYIKRYWYYLPIFIIFKYLKKEYFEYAISFFLFGMLISEVLSYGNYFTFWKIGFGAPHDPTVFMQHTLYSIFLSVTSIFLLSKIIYAKNNKKKMIYLLFFITVTINLLIGSGRTGYFTLFITLIIVVFFIYKAKLKIILTTIVTISIVLFLSYTLSPNFKNRISSANSDITKVINNSNYSTPIGARIGFWIIAKEITKDNLLLGLGVANNINKKNEYITTNKLTNFNYVKKLEHFHNNFLEIITQFGIVGLALFIYLFFLISRIEIKDKTIYVLKISTLSIFLIGSLSDMLFYLNDTMFLFSFTIGIILAKYKLENQDSKLLINQG